MFRAVQVRPENHAVIGNFAEIGETEYLKPAGIGEDRPRPGHERMQAAHLADEFMARAKGEMVGVREKNLDAEIFEILLRLSLDRRGCAHGHEGGSVNYAVRSGQAAQTRSGRVGGKNLEMK